MVLHWIFFASLVALAYIGISYVGQMTGGESPSVGHTILKMFNPVIFAVLIVANTTFSASLYYGFLVTSTAISVAVSIGVIVSFSYSVVIIGAAFSFIKIFGVFLILSGIYLIS